MLPILDNLALREFSPCIIARWNDPDPSVTSIIEEGSQSELTTGGYHEIPSINRQRTPEENGMNTAIRVRIGTSSRVNGSSDVFPSFDNVTSEVTILCFDILQFPMFYSTSKVLFSDLVTLSIKGRAAISSWH